MKVSSVSCCVLLLLVQEVPVEEEKTPLDGKVTYSNPEEALNRTNFTSSHHMSSQKYAQVSSNSQPTPEQPKPHTIQKDKMILTLTWDVMIHALVVLVRNLKSVMALIADQNNAS